MQHLLQERKTGVAIAPALALKGWKRDRHNNTFEKDDKEAYFSNGWLVFHFAGAQLIGKYSKSFHRIKI